MVETAKNWECGDHGNIAYPITLVHPWFGNTWINALVRSRVV